MCAPLPKCSRSAPDSAPTGACGNAKKIEADILLSYFIWTTKLINHHQPTWICLHIYFWLWLEISCDGWLVKFSWPVADLGVGFFSITTWNMSISKFLSFAFCCFFVFVSIQYNTILEATWLTSSNKGCKKAYGVKVPVCQHTKEDVMIILATVDIESINLSFLTPQILMSWK